MKINHAFLPRPMLVLLVSVAGVLQAQSAQACRSDEECKSPRVCVMGTCAAPPAASAPSCVRDIDCGGADVCESGRCVSMMSTSPGEADLTPPTTMNPPGGQEAAGPPEPGLQITPHRTETPAPPAQPQPQTTPPPPPETAPPPPPRPRPPRPPPDARMQMAPDEPPPTPPPTYHGRPTKPLLPPRFDLYAGVGTLFLETTRYSTMALGVGVDAQFLIGVAPSLAVGLRAGTVLVLESKNLDLWMAYVAPGLVVPSWHTGLFIGGASARGPYEKRLGGVQFEIPYEWAFAPFLKLNVVAGLGIFPGISPMYERTLRVEIGF